MAVGKVCDSCAIIMVRGCRLWHGAECPRCGYAPSDARTAAGHELGAVVARAVAAGASHSELRALFNEVLARFFEAPVSVTTWPTLW